MWNNGKLPETKCLFELYRDLGLSTKLFDTEREGFVILNLKDVGFKLPFKSSAYRPDFYSFLFVEDGEGDYRIDDQYFESKPGTIYFTNPSNYRTFGWSRINNIYLLTFDEDFLKQYVSSKIYEVFPFLLTETISPKAATEGFFAEVKVLYLQMEREYMGSSSDKYSIIGHLVGVLLYRIKDYFWKDYNFIREGDRNSHIVKSFKLMLEKNYRNILSGGASAHYNVQDYAQALHLNPNYFSSVIKCKTGKPVSSWIIDKTMLEAKSLLINTSYSINELSCQLGFAEAAHFSNYFKKYAGISPSKYRKSR